MELAHSILEKRFLADEVSISQVSASRAEIETERQKLNEMERLCEMARNAIKEIDVQIQQAEQNLIIAKRDFVVDQKTRIGQGLDKDQKIRALLMEAYAAMLSNPHGYNGNWTLFVTSIFTSTPNQIEIDSAIAAFSHKHNLN